MRAIFQSSTVSSAPTTTTTTTTATVAADSPITAASATTGRSLLKSASSSQLSRSSTSETLAADNNNNNTFSLSSSSTFPRRIKSKASLRSLGSSYFDDHDRNDTTAQQQGSSLDEKTLVRPSILRRLSPGLAARVKLLDGSSNKTATPSRPRQPSAVGRIPQEHLKELDSLHQDLSIKVQRRGRAWSGLHGTRGGRRKQSVSNIVTESEHRDEDAPPVLHVDVVTEPLELPAGLTLDPTEERGSLSPLDPESASSNRDISTATDAAMSMSVAGPTLRPSHSRSGSAAVDGQTDFEKYLQRSTQDDDFGRPPPPPPKDSPPLPSAALSNTNNNVQSYFNPMGLHRTESIYSFSRASFSNQLSQLTSIALPQPSSLEAGIAGIANAPAAVKALTGAAEQIQYWIKKAYDVLSGLDAEDDVEWAAAAGREGLDGVDKAIGRFESLVNIYVAAIEDVQLRPDIGDAAPDGLKGIVSQMELILRNWAEIKAKLKAVKEQVELAMEWEELWTNVLGDVGQEVDSLSGLIFEMEEKRHMTLAGEEAGMESAGGGGGGLDISELETIVEESPSIGHISSKKRVGSGPGSSNAGGTANVETPIIQTPQDDSNYTNLMGLFARMQPLRASLDFLPMRLSMFQSRADKVFPSACEELEHRRKELEQSYRTLEADAGALKKELEEDRWILVFRNAGQQAQRMFDSVERSIAKLQECLEMGAHLHNVPALTKRMESYEAKKQHYVPAIERVVSIIQKGVNDRLTVNGEILSLLSDMQSRTDALKASIKVMDASMEEINLTRSQQLRDSISSIITMDSPATGSAVDTPGSSPASSVVMHPVGGGGGAKGSTTPLGSSSRRGSSVGSSTARNTLSKTRRYSGIPPPPSTLTGRKSSIPKVPASALPSPAATRTASSSAISPTPVARKPLRPPAASTPVSNKPRWNASTNTADLDTGHNFKSLAVTTPSSAYRKASAPPRLSRASSTVSALGPFSREQSASPGPGTGTLRSTSRMSSRLGMRSPAAHTTTSPSPSRSVLLDPPPYSKLRKPSAPPGATAMPTVPRSRQSFAGKPSSATTTGNDGSDPNVTTPSKASRPGTALGHSTNRRVSLLPLPKSKIGGGKDGSTSSGRSKLDDRPPWRG